MYKEKFNLFTKIQSWFERGTPLFASRMSLLASIFIAVIGIVLGIVENSLAVKINGLIAGVDVLNSVLLINAVSHSMKSPDYVFNYGYGKYESISTLASAGLFFIVSGYTLYETVLSFGLESAESGNYYLLISFSLISYFLMRFMSRFERNASAKFKIPMLEYDANIWKVDSYIELGILVNLLLGIILSFNNLNYYARIIDSITAMLLMIYALKTPIKGYKNALDQLLDRTLPDDIQFQIFSIVAEHLDKMCEYKKVHTRQSGKDIFIEIDLLLPFDYTMTQKSELESVLQSAIREKFPTAISRIYASPCSGDCLKNGERNCAIFNVNT